MEPRFPPLRAPGVGAPTPSPPALLKRLRGWELGLPVGAAARGLPPPAIIAVGGGKGGVGKSLVAANLAVRIASSGLKVLAIDLDVGGANLHTYFGVTAPRHGLAEVCVYRQMSFGEVMAPTTVDGVRLVAGGREDAWSDGGGVGPAALRTLVDALIDARAAGEVDVAILDLGAGTHRHTIDFFSAAHLGLVTVLPEPTSIENAYLFMKTLLFRLVDTVGEQTGMPAAADAVRAELANAADARRSTGYAERLRHAAQQHPAFVGMVAQALAGRTVGIAVNQVRSQKDIDVGKSMELIGERYFGFQTRSCGYLNYDEAAWKSLRNRRLLVVDFPHSVLSRRFSDLARLVLANLGY